ncbi:MAG TPA: universal stress protein [Mycobacteriales bacterium]|nr:universal stress protein [Mycobacteriales bacterium]
MTRSKVATSFAQVVLPVDFSPRSWRVLSLATRMAHAFGVPRHVLHVDTSSPWLDEGSHAMVVGNGPAGGRVKVDVVAARSAADGIVSLLDQEQSLLVMSTRGHNVATELVTGSTADGVLHRWHGPMLLAGPRYQISPVPFRRVVLCLDPEFSGMPTALAEDVQALATAFDLPIEVLAIMDRGPEADYHSILRQNLRLEEATEALSADERVVRLVRLTGTHPGRDITQYVEAKTGTLVALTTHARPPLARVLFGSTAMAVIRHVTSPVLVRRFPTR